MAPGRNKATSKLACAADGGDWSAVTTSAENREDDSKKQLKKYEKGGQERFLAALHFDGLNHIAYVNIKSDVHNGWLV